MKQEDFEELVRTEVDLLEVGLRNMAAKGGPDWDIHDPVLYGWVMEDGKPQRGRLHVEVLEGSAPNKEELMEAFREVLPKLPAVAGAILCGGWELHPETHERQGEMVLFTVEDPDDHAAFVRFKLTRNEGAPPTLGEKEVMFAHDGERGGRMSGFFHPPKPKLN